MTLTRPCVSLEERVAMLSKFVFSQLADCPRNRVKQNSVLRKKRSPKVRTFRSMSICSMKCFRRRCMLRSRAVLIIIIFPLAFDLPSVNPKQMQHQGSFRKTNLRSFRILFIFFRRRETRTRSREYSTSGSVHCLDI